MEEMIKGTEKEFLHDLSNHLVVALGMTSSVTKILSDKCGEEDKELIRINKAVNSLTKIVKLIEERREVIKESISRE
jgi:hypothetical protein